MLLVSCLVLTGCPGRVLNQVPFDDKGRATWTPVRDATSHISDNQLRPSADNQLGVGSWQMERPNECLCSRWCISS